MKMSTCVKAQKEGGASIRGGATIRGNTVNERLIKRGLVETGPL